MVEYILTDLDDNFIDSGYKQTKRMQNIKHRYNYVESTEEVYDTYFLVINTFYTKHFILKEYIKESRIKHLKNTQF